jgi:hypothetical protein
MSTLINIEHSDSCRCEWCVDKLKELIKQLQDENQGLKEVLFSQGHIYEDDLPELTDEQFDFAFRYSTVDVVRIYPKILIEYIEANA